MPACWNESAEITTYLKQASEMAPVFVRDRLAHPGFVLGLTNWLLGAEPELYLYAALLKSAPYTVDDERLPIWASLYTDALNRLNISSKVALVSGGPLVRGRRGFG